MGICLETIEAYVEGAISTQRVYLQGPEANVCLRAFSYPGMKSAWSTGGKRRNAR